MAKPLTAATIGLSLSMWAWTSSRTLPLQLEQDRAVAREVLHPLVRRADRECAPGAVQDADLDRGVVGDLAQDRGNSPCSSPSHAFMRSGRFISMNTIPSRIAMFRKE